MIEDSVLRAMADDGSFRVIVARTNDTVRGAIGVQKVVGPVAERLGDLVTGAILVRETMAPGLRVQGIMKTKTGSLVADAHPDGATRALVQGSREMAPPEGAVMQMMRSLPNGSVHQGYVEVPETGGVSASLMAYMQQSEQVESVVAVGTVLDAAGAPVAAGGYVVQLLPEAKHDALAVMTSRIEGLRGILELLGTGGLTPREVVAELLGEMPFTILEENAVRYACQCSQERVLASLTTVGATELRSMLDEQRTFEITCDFCATDYKVTPADLTIMLSRN